MANLDKLIERQHKISKQIEEEKEKAHKELGAELIKQFQISYDSISTKKDIKETIETIKGNLNQNPFLSNDSEEKYDKKLENEDKDMIDTNDKQSEYY